MSTRDVNLLSYLPQFLQDFSELEVTLEAEDPEFALMWEAANQVLDNAFIATADEYGISRYESLLGLSYSSSDTLESRRAKVLARWFFALPYTLRMLIIQLKAICESDDVAATVDTDTYTLYIVMDVETYGVAAEVDALLLEMVPANIVIDCANTISVEVEGEAGAAGGIAYGELIYLTNDEQKEHDLTSGESGGGVTSTYYVYAVNDDEWTADDITGGGSGGGIVYADIVTISNDEQADYELSSGESGGAVSSTVVLATSN